MMNSFLNCAVYLALTGIFVFVLGRIMPKKWFKPDKFPFKAVAFEKSGKIYNRFNIRYWQSRVPDMSKIFGKIMPPKDLSGNYKDRIDIMINETCVAESAHILHSVLSLYCLRYGVLGFVLTVINILFLNLPFIMIQRYNRPRLIRLFEKTKARG